MQAKLSCNNLCKQLSKVESPIRFNTFVMSQSIDCFLSRINNAMEEIDIDIDNEIKMKDNVFEQLPSRNVKKLTIRRESNKSMTTSSFSGYEGNIDFDEQTLLDEISEFHLD